MNSVPGEGTGQVIGERKLGGVEAWAERGEEGEERLRGPRKSKSRVKARERKAG